MPSNKKIKLKKKKKTETVLGDWKFPCLDRALGYSSVFICQNSSSGTLRICAAYCVYIFPIREKQEQETNTEFQLMICQLKYLGRIYCWLTTQIYFEIIQKI